MLFNIMTDIFYFSKVNLFYSIYFRVKIVGVFLNDCKFINNIFFYLFDIFISFWILAVCFAVL